MTSYGVLHILDFEILYFNKAHSTLKLYLDESWVGEKRRKSKDPIFSPERITTLVDTYSLTMLFVPLLNLPNNILPIIIHGNHRTWSDAKNSPDLVTKVQLWSTKTSWAGKVPDNFAILRTQLCSSSTIRRVSTSISENYRDRVIK